MTTRTLIRVSVLAAASVVMVWLLGAGGLVGVVLAVPALAFAPSRGRGLSVREVPSTPEAALAEWSKADGRAG
jgi:hypothetical protein